MADVYELFLTCPKGLESLLLEEAQGLGLDEARAQVSAVRGQGSLEVAYRLCLWSRLANRVLLVLARFPVENAESMYMAVHAVNWEDHLDAGGTLAVEFSGKGSGIDNTHFGALKVKDAIVDNLRERLAGARRWTRSIRTCASTCTSTAARRPSPWTSPGIACTSVAIVCSRAPRR